MNRSLRLALVLPWMVLAASMPRMASAQNPPVAEYPSPQVLTPAPRVKPTPMVAELLASIELERTQIAELRRALPSGRDRTQRLELQRRIERLKLDGEVARLRVQIGYAQREGRPAVAEVLQRALDMIQPPVAAGLRNTPARSEAR